MSTATGTAIISAQVPAAMRAELQRLAAQQDRTVSALIRRAVAEHLARDSTEGRRTT
jgi:predicted transcriptional regulator